MVSAFKNPIDDPFPTQTVWGHFFSNPRFWSFCGGESGSALFQTNAIQFFPNQDCHSRLRLLNRGLGHPELLGGGFKRDPPSSIELEGIPTRRGEPTLGPNFPNGPDERLLHIFVDRSWGEYATVVAPLGRESLVPMSIAVVSLPL